MRCFVDRRETRQHSRSSSNGGSESKKAVSIVNPVLYVIVHLVDDVADNGGRWERRVNPTFVQRL